MSMLGEFLKSKRVSLKLTLREAEEQSGVSNAYISLIESGKREDPHPKILKRLGATYNVDVLLLMEMAGYLGNDPEENRVNYQRAILPLPSNDSAIEVEPCDWSIIDDEIQIEARRLIGSIYRKIQSKKYGK